MKLICVSQHCVLKVVLLMWSSPAALEKVKLSASMLLNVAKSLVFHAVYHLRMSSSLIKLGAPVLLALTDAGRVAAPTSAHAPVASIFLRDTEIFVIVYSPFYFLSRHSYIAGAALPSDHLSTAITNSVMGSGPP